MLLLIRVPPPLALYLRTRPLLHLPTWQAVPRKNSLPCAGVGHTTTSAGGATQALVRPTDSQCWWDVLQNNVVVVMDKSARMIQATRKLAPDWRLSPPTLHLCTGYPPTAALVAEPHQKYKKKIHVANVDLVHQDTTRTRKGACPVSWCSDPHNHPRKSGPHAGMQNLNHKRLPTARICCRVRWQRLTLSLKHECRTARSLLCGTGSARSPGRSTVGGCLVRNITSHALAWTRLGPSRLPSVRAATSNGGVARIGGGHCLCSRPHRVHQSQRLPRWGKNTRPPHTEVGSLEKMGPGGVAWCVVRGAWWWRVVRAGGAWWCVVRGAWYKNRTRNFRECGHPVFRCWKKVSRGALQSKDGGRYSRVVVENHHRRRTAQYSRWSDEVVQQQKLGQNGRVSEPRLELHYGSLTRRDPMREQAERYEKTRITRNWCKYIREAGFTKFVEAVQYFVTKPEVMLEQMGVPSSCRECTNPRDEPTVKPKDVIGDNVTKVRSDWFSRPLCIRAFDGMHETDAYWQRYPKLREIRSVHKFSSFKIDDGHVVIKSRKWQHFLFVNKVLSHYLPISKRIIVLLRHASALQDRDGAGLIRKSWCTMSMVFATQLQAGPLKTGKIVWWSARTKFGSSIIPIRTIA